MSFPSSATALPSAFAAIAANPFAVAPYLACAEALDAIGDPRANLIRIQIAMESARGAELQSLWNEERAILTEHADMLFGPQASAFRSAWARQARYTSQGRLGWADWFFRGFISRIMDFGVPPLLWRADPAERSAVLFEEVPAIMLAPELRFCRAVDFPIAPRRLPPGVERARLGQAVITDALLSEPCLRELGVTALVDSVRLVHDGLEELHLPGDEAAIQALEGARLPALRRLVLSELDAADPELLGRLAQAVAALDIDPEVEFVFALPVHVQNVVGNASLDALRPAAPRITAIALNAGLTELDLRWDADLPRLRRLDVAGALTAEALRSPAFRSVDQLFIAGGVHGYLGAPVIEALVRSGLAPTLRVLGLYFEQCAVHRQTASAVKRLAAVEWPRLKELMVTSHYAPNQADVFAELPAEAFPNLERARVSPHLVAPTREGARRGRVQVDPVPSARPPYWRDAFPLSVVPPQFEGIRRGPAEPDLTSFPRYADIWRAGMAFDDGVRAALVARGKKKPPELAACDPFLSELSVTLDYIPLLKLDGAERGRTIEAWYAAIEAALRARDGEVASRIFRLAGPALRARNEVVHRHQPPPRPVCATRFLALSEDLPEPARSELAEVRGWCRWIARGRAPSRCARRAVLPREYGLRVLGAPFAERPSPFEAPAAPPTFETATPDHVRRSAMWWGIRAVVMGNRDWSFDGNARSGAVSYASGTGADMGVAWCPEGVVAFAYDVNSAGEVEEGSAMQMLGKVPAALGELAVSLFGRRIAYVTSALWISGNARRRCPAERVNGCERGIEYLDAFVGPAPRVRDGFDDLIDALVDRAVSGGGDLLDDEIAQLTDAGGRGGPEVLERLWSLGLRRP
jgi:hypothetical protein